LISDDGLSIYISIYLSKFLQLKEIAMIHKNQSQSQEKQQQQQAASSKQQLQK
jgi:hypothetical protein